MCCERLRLSASSSKKGTLIMAEFTAEYQNEFLPEAGTDVNAIVTITCSGQDRPVDGSGDEIIIVDTSGSMGRAKLEAAKVAAAAAGSDH